MLNTNPVVSSLDNNIETAKKIAEIRTRVTDNIGYYLNNADKELLECMGRSLLHYEDDSAEMFREAYHAQTILRAALGMPRKEKQSCTL